MRGQDEQQTNEKMVARFGEVLAVDKSEPGEACSVCDVTGWERIRAQMGSRATEAVGPKEIANALKVKETVASKKGIGHVAANGRTVENFGEKRIVGHTDAGDALSMRIQNKHRTRRRAARDVLVGSELGEGGDVGEGEVCQ